MVIFNRVATTSTSCAAVRAQEGDFLLTRMQHVDRIRINWSSGPCGRSPSDDDDDGIVRWQTSIWQILSSPTSLAASELDIRLSVIVTLPVSDTNRHRVAETRDRREAVAAAAQ
jgi:hypothetical protein